ncbi:Hypothetical protein PHPALM_19772 [Phytophthora palmivora]|uniref:Uncharacterized protein n=1 Tax=Phytophthora palmivora TaxID=4796 RepID=A0A2P4XGJ0_9STRA|nr:Hypothetical protein PHPALM_19772 [Phytophthora palmivora]
MGKQPTLTLNEILELPYYADSESENILLRRHAGKLCQLDKTLCEPIKSQAVGGAVLTVTHTTGVGLMLNTAAGPVRCQDLKRCLIVEMDEDEVLVGKILLLNWEWMFIDNLNISHHVLMMTIRLCNLRYSPEKSAFLKTFNRKLADLGWVYENHQGRWCCPVLPVKKPNTGDYRHALQPRCSTKTAEYLLYMTDKGVVTPTHVPQGKTQSELLDAIDAVLQKLDEYGFIFNPKKCSLYQTDIQWCACIINKNGIGYNPERIEAFRSIPPRTTAAELKQYCTPAAGCGLDTWTMLK